MPRKTQRGAAPAITNDVGIRIAWEWEGNSVWQHFCASDVEILESNFNSRAGVGCLIVRFCFAQDTDYEIDFENLTQKNLETSKIRKIRRTNVVSSWNGDSKIPDPPELSALDVRQQGQLGSQSKRTCATINFGPQISAHTHATRCFQAMLLNEEKYSGDWAVFYHSYNNPALIYELQAAIAAVLFRFKSNYSTLPRLMRGCFTELPDAPTLMAVLPTWPEMDHSAKFKSVGICATVSLLAPDSEAPPTGVFLSGYNVGPISTSIIHGMLTTCGVTSEQAARLTTQLVALAEQHGLHVAAFGGRASTSGCPGHLLQIFIRRHLVDKHAYAAHPMGAPDHARHPLGAYLRTPGPLRGQARIVVHPSAFLRAARVRANVFSADEAFHARRPAFQRDLTALLAPILGAGPARERAARGVFGGALPAWFDPADQRRFAAAAGGPAPLPPAPPPAPAPPPGPAAPSAGGRQRRAAAAAAAGPAKRRRRCAARDC
jgi:hypothetical protein